MRQALLGLVLLLSCGLGHAQAPESSDWTESTYGHYRIVTDGDPRIPARLALLLAEMEAALETMFPSVSQGWAKHPLIVVAFESGNDFRPFSMRGSSRTVLGFVSNRERDSVMVLQLPKESHFRRANAFTSVVRHEFVHYWAHKYLPELPSWLHEGLATFIATAEFANDEVTVGLQDENSVQWLLHMDRLLTPREMLDFGIWDAGHSEGHKIAEFYAQSWLTVHYLIFGDQGNALGAYVQRLRAHVDPYEAFTQSLALSDAEFDATLRRHFQWVTGRGPALKVELGSLFTIHLDDKRPLNEAERDYYYGKIWLRPDDEALDKAEEHFQRSLERWPEFGAAHYGLGRTHELRGELPLADAAYERAIELDPKHFDAHLDLGVRYLWSEARALEAPAMLEAALKLQPDNPHALGYYAMSTLPTEPLLGVQAMQPVLAQLPFHELFHCANAILKASAGDLDGGRRDREVLAKWVSAQALEWMDARLSQPASTD